MLLDVMMQGDETFSSLPHTTRHWAHEGKTFVIWQAHKNTPQIRALLRVDNVALNPEQGLRLAMTVSTPAKVFDFWMNEKPQKIAGLGIYIWVEAHTDLRFVPLHDSNPWGKRSLQISFRSRSSARSDKTLQNGTVGINTVAEFSNRWPQHAF